MQTKRLSAHFPLLIFRGLLITGFLLIAMGNEPHALSQNVTLAAAATPANNSSPAFTKQLMISHAGRLLTPLDTKQPLDMSVALRERDSAGLTAYLADIYNPTSPNFHHFLSADDYAARFAPDSQTRQQVSDWLQGQGFKLVANNPAGSLVSFVGTAGQAQAAFKLQLQQYQKSDGSQFFANDRTPALPSMLATKIVDVFGLSSEFVQHPNYEVLNAQSSVVSQTVGQLSTALPAASASPTLIGPRRGPNGTNFTPAEIRAAYNIPANYTGAGRTIALYELGGYNPQDIDTFDQTFGLPLGNRQDIGLDGQAVTGNDGDIQVEVELDIEIANAIAPQAKILVYCAPLRATGLAGYLDLNQRIATDNLADTISQSYGQNEINFIDSGQTSFLEAENNIFRQQAAQGQSMFTSAGDGGSGNTPPLVTNQIPQDPAAQPYLTSVGGTRLYVSGNATTTTYLTEAVWNRGIRVNAQGNLQGDAGGGGISQYWPASSVPWQSGSGVNNQYMAAQMARQYPDVSGDSDPATGYAIYSNNAGTTGWFTIGGTSAASPLWAAITAAGDAIGNKRLGLLNPALYGILQNSSQYASDFHDITQGNNDPFCTPGSGYCDSDGPFYPATVGYDLASGLGTPNVARLVPDLLNMGTAAVYLGIDQYPYLGADLNGSAVSKTVTLSSFGGSPINYTASVAVTTTNQWFKISPATGTISGTQALVLTATPAGLTVGDFVATVTFSGTSNGQSVPPVTMQLYFKVGTLHVSTTNLNYTLSDTGPNYLTQTVTITTTAPSPQTYAIGIQDFLGFVAINGFIYDTLPGLPLITVSSAQPVSLTFGVALNGPTFLGNASLAPGAYTANISLLSAPVGSIDQIDVGLNLKVAGQSLTAQPLTLNFRASPGASLPSPQLITVTATPTFTSAASVPVTASFSSPSFANYFTVSPTTATIAPGGTLTFTVTPLTTNLGSGNFDGAVVITSSLDTSVVAQTNIVYSVQPQAHLGIATPLGTGSTDLVFNQTTAQPGVFSQVISLTALNGSVSYTSTTGVFGYETPWLSFTPSSDNIGLGETNTAIVTVDTTHLGVGSYHGYIQLYDLTNPKGDGPLRLAVLVNVSGPNSAATISYAVPIFSNRVQNYITLQNLGLDPANVTVNYYDGDGTPNRFGASVVTTTISSAGQQVIPVTTLNPRGISSAVLSSNQPLNVLVNTAYVSPSATTGYDTAYSVAPILTNTTKLYVPTIFHGALGGFNSSLTLLNAGNSPTSGVVQYYDQAGNPATVQDNFTLQPHALTVFSQENRADLASNKNYTAVISSTPDSQLSVLVGEFNFNANFQAYYQAIASTSDILYVPTAYNEAFGSYNTGIALANPNGVVVTATIVYLDSTGFLNGIKQLIIPANGVGLSYTPDSTGSGFTGSAVIYATSPIVGTVNEAGAGGAGTYPALTKASQSLGLVAVSNGFAGFNSGATILNVSASPIQLALQYANPDGTIAGPTSIYTLQSGASLLAYQGAAQLPPNFFGTLVITSSAPNSIVAAVNASQATNHLFYTYTGS